MEQDGGRRWPLPLPLTIGPSPKPHPYQTPNPSPSPIPNTTSGKAELGLDELTKLVARLSGDPNPDPQLMKVSHPYPHP